ncbi:MAG: hypothetical protein IJN28_00825 [Selenomonadales bacterium]|nr:hypothetical protein [Selenomonadales bacterium]
MRWQALLGQGGRRCLTGVVGIGGGWSAAVIRRLAGGVSSGASYGVSAIG